MNKSKIAEAIEKHRNHQQELRIRQLEERQKYLEFCENESKTIIDALTEEILDDIELSGIAYINAVDKYATIFQIRISGLVADALRKEGLELALFPASRVIRVSIDPNPLTLK